MYRKHTYQNILFTILGSLLEKSIDIHPQKVSLKLIIGTWLMFAFVITNSYKAVLLSILTLPPLSGIRDIPDLAKAAEKNSATCYTYTGALLQQIFLEAEIDTWRAFDNCLKRNVITLRNAEEAFKQDTFNKAFITARDYMKPYKQDYFISEDSFFNIMHAFSVSKHFCCLSYLNKMIHRLFAAGLFQKIENDEEYLLELSMVHTNTDESSQLKVLQLRDLKGAFIVLFTGYALSTIQFFIEIRYKYNFLKSIFCFITKRKKISKKV